MSTRSRIGILKKDKSIESIYCHFDGYLEYVGKLLYSNYSNYDDVKELIKLGDISSLRKKIKPNTDVIHTFDNPQDDVTVSYHRDRKEEWEQTKPLVSKNINDFNKILDDSWIEYIYLYDEEKNKWMWDDVGYKNHKIELKDLDKAIKCIDKVALKSGYYFMLFDKGEVPFLNQLNKTNRQVKVDGWIYYLYDAPNWDLAKKIDSLMGNDSLGYDIDDYEIKKDINI